MHFLSLLILFWNFPFPLVSKCWHFSFLYFPHEPWHENVSPCSRYLDTKALQIAAQPWKAFYFSAGEPSEPGEDILTGVSPEDSEVVMDGTLPGLWLPQHSSGSSFPSLCLYYFLPWVEDPAQQNGDYDIFEADETHGHRWWFPRYGFPDDIPVIYLQSATSVTTYARLRSPRCPRGRSSPMLSMEVRGQREGRGVHLYTQTQRL